MNAKLKKAVEIFKELGWEGVSPENVLDLPLGTAEQKKAALEGLKSGDFGEYVVNGNNYSYKPFFTPEYLDKLTIFAIRVGVTAPRSRDMLNWFHANKEMLFAVVKARGAKFSRDFVNAACAWGFFSWADYASETGSIYTLMCMVNELLEEVPQNTNYLTAWAQCAAAALGINDGERFAMHQKAPDVSLIEKRFEEHIRVGVALNATAMGYWGLAKILPAGVKRGLFPRDEAVEMVFSALDSAIRPGDRLAWVGAIDTLEISDTELTSRVQSLIPLLSSGESPVISRLAPVLIANANEEFLTEVLLASFSATTKKAKKLLLKAALERDCPPMAEELSPWLSIFASDTDKSIATLAVKLSQKWKIEAEELPEDETETSGLWQETPPVWEVPRFEIGEATPENLTEFAASLLSRRSAWEGDVFDVETERFMAMINEVARENPQDARVALQGVRGNGSFLLEMTELWVKGKKNQYHSDAHPPYSMKAHPPLGARNHVVFSNFGKLPCILSTPSKVDLTITVPDLAARLDAYKLANMDVLEADLYLALTRLDVKTATPQELKHLKNSKVYIRLQSGERLKVMKLLIRTPLTAGQAVLNYLENPIAEPALKTRDNSQYLQSEKLNYKNAFNGFPERLQSPYYGSGGDMPSIFPTMGDGILCGFGSNYGGVSHNMGLIMRQIARRSAPLPSGVAINFLAAMRSPSQHAAEDAIRAVNEAWERGLLRPNVADISYLDWRRGAPSNVAALAVALEGIARDGILSVVWPVLDELVGASLTAARLLAGTAEIVQLISAFIPEVQLAIEKNLAPKHALDLPNTRELAKRGGSSQAVQTAKKIAESLPPMQNENTPPAAISAAVPFDEIWGKTKKPPKILEDGVEISVDFIDDKHKTLLFSLTHANQPNKVFYIKEEYSLWSYEYQGAALATRLNEGEPYKFDRDNCGSLHWDASENTLLFKKDSHRGLNNKNPFPLSAALNTVVVGLLAQDKLYHGVSNILTKLAKSNQLGADMVRRAAQTLLKSPAISPAKLVRILEKEVTLLPVLWPLLTESIKVAGEISATEKNPPTWANRVLDVALQHADYLKEAAKRGLIPAEDAGWQGLSSIANSKSKSTSVAKAGKLLDKVAK
ncbi:MAG: hypothetical protein FWB96_02120 [Defluviitaleaceae bacterium]|nr:hypothetical protein [Defluviitaleaceae bacterium]MCL2261993.1 hypothetical protein [Defluviitaleaceae bacterium]